MVLSRRFFRLLVVIPLFAIAFGSWAAGLQVLGNVGKVIPIALEGYVGEVQQVLAFDLEVQQLHNTPPNRIQL